MAAEKNAEPGLTPDDVMKVALLGRLALSGAELSSLTEELTKIVGFVSQLSEVDTAAVDETGCRRGRSRSTIVAAIVGFTARFIGVTAVPATLGISSSLLRGVWGLFWEASDTLFLGVADALRESLLWRACRRFAFSRLSSLSGTLYSL